MIDALGSDPFDPITYLEADDPLDAAFRALESDVAKRHAVRKEPAPAGLRYDFFKHTSAATTVDGVIWKLDTYFSYADMKFGFLVRRCYTNGTPMIGVSDLRWSWEPNERRYRDPVAFLKAAIEYAERELCGTDQIGTAHFHNIIVQLFVELMRG